ncbi:hypothetical protein TIFTF001_029844 [Ficus carica]|uniref:Uncharacterized protein n=1 Tax=Ficus carica TaxID=3494 RepID=A0AA88DWJ1_FICCA|nr:hypothetical protein TIFTF001_029844 [Ficus carica]
MSAELGCVELPKVVAMDGSRVLKIMAALNRLWSLSFSALNLNDIQVVGMFLPLSSSQLEQCCLGHGGSGCHVVKVYNISHRPHGGHQTIEEMMSDELGGSPMISLMPWSKISSLGVILVKMK